MKSSNWRRRVVDIKKELRNIKRSSLVRCASEEVVAYPMDSDRRRRRLENDKDPSRLKESLHCADEGRRRVPKEAWAERGNSLPVTPLRGISAVSISCTEQTCKLNEKGPPLEHQHETKIRFGWEGYHSSPSICQQSSQQRPSKPNSDNWQRTQPLRHNSDNKVHVSKNCSELEANPQKEISPTPHPPSVAHPPETTCRSRNKTYSDDEGKTKTRNVQTYTFQSSTKSLPKPPIFKNISGGKYPRLLTNSKSLDYDEKPKYTGYKPANGVNFITFKNMFTKQNQCQNVVKGDETLKWCDYCCGGCICEKLSENERWKSSSLDSDRRVLKVQNSESFLSEKELKVLEKTRSDLRLQIISAERNKVDNMTKKIPLNIFLRHQAENSSVDAPDIGDATEMPLQKDQVQDPNGIKINNNCVINDPGCQSEELSNAPSQDPPGQLDPPVDLEELERIKAKNLKEDVQTMMSLRCPSPNLTNEFSFRTVYDRVVSKCNDNQQKDLVKDRSNETGTSVPSTPLAPRMDFLRTLTNESKYYASAKFYPIKSAKPTTFNIETEFCSTYGSQSPSNPPVRASRINSQPVKSGSSATVSKGSSIMKSECMTHIDGEMELYQKPIQAVIFDVQDDYPTQDFRKKLEEAKELHRRLHFCKVNVSKETVIRALMSPAQIKMYEKLYSYC